MSPKTWSAMAAAVALSMTWCQTDGLPGPPAGAQAVPLWAWCPDPESVADPHPAGWGWTLEVTPDALYCATFDEHRSLDEELGAKAQLRLLEGLTRLPHEDGTDVLWLPTCFRIDPQGGVILSQTGAGVVVSKRTPVEETGALRYRFDISVPLSNGFGDPWRLIGLLTGELPAGKTTVSIDGRHLEPGDGTAVWLQLCHGDCAASSDVRPFDACVFDGVETHRHEIVFDGGQVSLMVDIGFDLLETEPALFWAASGILDDAPFEQVDYWHLLYNPTLHHFSRDFLVLFDDPMGEVCGLRVLHADPWGDDPPVEITTVDCDLADVEARVVAEETWQIVP